MESLSWLIKGFGWALEPINILCAFTGAFLGTAVGVLPGLGPTATMALIMSLLAGFTPGQALVILAGVYYGAMYGGSTTAIMMNIPGESAAVITALDGYALAREGKAGPALAIAAISSFVAAMISMVGLVIFAPPLAEVALAFAPPEYLGLAIFSLSLVVGLSGKSLKKGLISCLLGIFVSMIGLDPLTAVPRFTMSSIGMLGGIDIVVACVGLFGISEILMNLKGIEEAVYSRITRLYPSLNELRQTFGSMIRSALTGFFPGLLPGVSSTTTAFLAYEVERKFSRRGHLLGTGVLEGVAAPEGANNSCISGQFVTLFSLGIPTSPVMAMLLAGMMVFGVQPGPRVFFERPDVIWTVVASMVIGNIFCVILNLPLVGLWVRLLSLPYKYLAPSILVVCIIGAYSVRNTLFDVWAMLAFGLLGYVMRRLNYPLAPMVMGMVLGPMLERSYRQSLGLLGSLVGIFDRPIAVSFLVLTVLYLAFSIGIPYLRRRRSDM